MKGVARQNSQSGASVQAEESRVDGRGKLYPVRTRLHSENKLYNSCIQRVKSLASSHVWWPENLR